MSRQYWQESIADEQGINGTAIAATTTETVLFPDNTIPNGYMRDGRKLRITAWGKFSNVITTPGTTTFRIRWGGVAGTIIAQSSAISLNILAETDLMFKIECDITVRANGGSGSVLAMGLVTLAAQLAANNNQPNFMGSAGGASTNTPAAVTVTFNADTALSVTAQSSVNTAGTTITGMEYTLEALN